jgi:hypothetical protein
MFIFTLRKLVLFYIFWFATKALRPKGTKSVNRGLRRLALFFAPVPPIFPERTFVYAGYRLKKAVCDG